MVEWAVGGARGGFVGHGGGGFAGAPRGAYWGGGYHGGYGYGYSGRYPYYGRYGYGRYPWWGYRAGYGWGWWGYPWAWGWYGGVGWSGDYLLISSAVVSGLCVFPSGQSQLLCQRRAAAGDRPAERRGSAPARRAAVRRNAKLRAQPPKAQIQAGTVLVFRDRHSEEIQNYAIVGKTLWVFTEQRARKIPIAELNVPATTKANEARGIDFRLPSQ